MIDTFCRELEDNGYYAGLYMSRFYLDNYVESNIKNRYAIWVAEYGNKCNYSGSYGMWQYSSTGMVNGINGNVDTNRVYFDYTPSIKSKGLKGRIYGSDASAFTVKAADLIKSSKNINLTYKTLVFSNCRLISFVGEENADGFLHADLEFATADDIGEAEGNG